MKSLLLVSLTCLFATVASLLNAAGPVSVSPTTVQVNGSGSSTVSLSWRVGVTSRVPRSVTISSPRAQLGKFGTVGGSLRQTVEHPGTGLVFFTFTERLSISRTMAARVAQNGVATLTRQFADFSGISPVATVRVRATSGGSLALRDARLTFDTGSLFEVTPQHASLTARLQITTGGRGVLTGTWEVSGPSGTMAGFRAIGRVRRVLAGARRITVESPVLPAQRVGVYRVRFVPAAGVDRGIDVTLPELRYTVTPIATPSVDGATRANELAPIALSSPSSSATLSSATQFGWKPVQNAARYRMEFFKQNADGPDPQPLAAVETTETSAQLKSFTRKRLFGAGALSWRITAFDRSGAVLARSAMRRLTQNSSEQPADQSTP